MALDGETFVGTFGDPLRASYGQKTSVVFIRRPEVTGVVPTNGLFDANTIISVTGDFFCNETASMPCSADPTRKDHWCIFDFQAVNPAADAWGVNRKYTPAQVVSDTQLVCKAPVIKPDTVPALSLIHI